MATTLVDRAEHTTAELSEAARAHLADAERYARQAALAAREAADPHVARAAESAQHAAAHAQEAAGHLAERVGDTVEALVDEVEELWEDPGTRPYLIGAAAGVALTGLALYLWRRRRRQREQREERYETSTEDLGGWEDPRIALERSETN